MNIQKNIPKKIHIHGNACIAFPPSTPLVVQTSQAAGSLQALFGGRSYGPITEHLAESVPARPVTRKSLIRWMAHWRSSE